jgi:DNA-binding NarL/FixJ family response regulator
MPLTTDERLLALSRDVLKGFEKVAGGIHPGFRPAHAKGILLTGIFTPSSEASSLTTAPHINQPSTPVTVGRNRLTPREREIVQLLAEGKSTKEVAVALGLSVKTAETHRSNIMRKLQLHSVSDLVLYAVRNNIVHVVQAGIE